MASVAKLLFDEVENNLHTHVDLENNILFPKAFEMEENKRSNRHREEYLSRKIRKAFSR